ncbi:MAG: lytic murein transglycosylase [Rhodobacteraceae bacterium]|nr:lytic murein transglycosylase [Paracoccaceae bacterium]
MLNHPGWHTGEPWINEVRLPRNFDWSATGLNTKNRSRLGVSRCGGPRRRIGAAWLGPPRSFCHRQYGPACLAYPNFHVFFGWNQSFVHAMIATYFSTRLEGAPTYNARNPDQGLNGDQMKALQRKGYDVGKVDGILCARTRVTVQAEQARLRLANAGSAIHACRRGNALR